MTSFGPVLAGLISDAKATYSVADPKEVGLAMHSLHHARVGANTAAISGHGSRLTTAETNVTALQTASASHGTRLSSAETSIASHGTSISGLTATTTDHTSRLEALEAVNVASYSMLASPLAITASAASMRMSTGVTSAALGTDAMHMSDSTPVKYDPTVALSSANHFVFTFGSSSFSAASTTASGAILLAQFHAYEAASGLSGSFRATVLYSTSSDGSVFSDPLPISSDISSTGFGVCQFSVPVGVVAVRLYVAISDVEVDGAGIDTRIQSAAAAGKGDASSAGNFNLKVLGHRASS